MFQSDIYLCVFVSSRLGREGGVAAEQRGGDRGGTPDGPGEVCWQLPDADSWEALGRSTLC